MVEPSGTRGCRATRREWRRNRVGDCRLFQLAQPCDDPSRAARRSAHHAPMLTRRKFAEAAAAAGAVLAFGRGSAAAPAWRERRDLYPQGVASGDPAPDSVLLWTRRQ